MKTQGARDAGGKKPAPKRRHDPAVTEANRARRIAKDKAAKERARRKRDQRMRATLNPKREAWTVSMVQQVFGDTYTRLCGWLADKANFKVYMPLSEGETRLYGNNDFDFRGVRKRFVTRNGYKVSIQQSATHYCGNDSVEMFNCLPHEMLESYGEGDSRLYSHVPLRDVAQYIDSYLYSHVPLRVVAQYIDWLETLEPFADVPC